MAVILHDTFNRSNSSSVGTATTGQSWSASGTQGISSNKAFVNSGYSGSTVNLTLTGSYVVRATFDTIDVTEEPSVVFWKQDTSVHVALTAVPAGYKITAFNFDDGFVTHATSSVVPVNGDILSIEVNYSTGVADVYRNGTTSGDKILTYTLPSGKYPMASLTGVGLNGSGVNSLFDEYYVADSMSDLPALGSPAVAYPRLDIGGTWKTPVGGWVNVGGTWRQIVGCYENVGGTWKSSV